MCTMPWVYQFLNIDFTSIELVCTKVQEEQKLATANSRFRADFLAKSADSVKFVNLGMHQLLTPSFTKVMEKGGHL
jgi:hypothetical protein